MSLEPFSYLQFKDIAEVKLKNEHWPNLLQPSLILLHQKNFQISEWRFKNNNLYLVPAETREGPFQSCMT